MDSNTYYEYRNPDGIERKPIPQSRIRLLDHSDEENNDNDNDGDRHNDDDDHSEKEETKTF